MSYQEDFEEEEDTGAPILTIKKILDICREHNLGVIPDLIDTLYLYHQGFPRIRRLEQFTSVKSLWLNDNAISVIENIGHMSELTTLNLQNNNIEEISGLDSLHELDTLGLAHNYILKVEGLSNLHKLNSIDLERNRLKNADSLRGLLECPSITILNIARNLLDDLEVLNVLAQMPNLKVLRMDGNPMVPKMHDYQRTVILKLKHLTYLDDTPISENDRRLALAWQEGGRQSEMAVRHSIRRLQDEKEQEAFKELRRLQRERAIADGKDLKDFPELLSSDDESDLIKKEPRIEEVNENNQSDID